MFWQKDADTCPLLYNMDKVDVSKPLCIVEGYFDCLAVIEAGYTNVVSINGGANDDNWIKFNYEWLENFKDIILWFDNDEAGEDGLHKVVTRLGEYRVRIVQTIEEDEDAVEHIISLFLKSQKFVKLMLIMFCWLVAKTEWSHSLTTQKHHPSKTLCI